MLHASRAPRLLLFYAELLRDRDRPRFVLQVSRNYIEATLGRLATDRSVSVRRAAVLALGLVGTGQSTGVLVERLRDPDRSVRWLAEDALRDVRARAAGPDAARELEACQGLMRAGQLEQALRRAKQLVRRLPGFAEGWRQLGMAALELGRLELAERSFRRCLQFEASNYLALEGLAQCYLLAGDLPRAVALLRQVLRYYPYLEHVRLRVRQIGRGPRWHLG